MGNLPKNATRDPVLFGIITITSMLCQRRQVYAGKKRLNWHRHINAFSAWKRVVDLKSINLGMIRQGSYNRQSFKKVTCPWNNKNKYSDRRMVSHREVNNSHYKKKCVCASGSVTFLPLGKLWQTIGEWEMYLPALCGKSWWTNQPTDRRTSGVLGKLHFQ